MTAYVRKDLGGNLFVIYWNLVVAGGVADIGDFYENDGAELLSIFGFSDTGLNVALGYSNVPTESATMNISGILTVPVMPGFEPPLSPMPVLPPPMWRYNAQAEAGLISSGAARVGLLFRQT